MKPAPSIESMVYESIPSKEDRLSESNLLLKYISLYYLTTKSALMGQSIQKTEIQSAIWIKIDKDIL